MGLVSRIQAAMAALAGAKASSGATVAWNNVFVRGLDFLAAAGGKMTQPFAQHPTVYAAVSAISQGISALPLEMFPDSAKKREQPLPKSIVKDLLDNPGFDMDGPQLLEATIDFMELDGEAFWFLDGFAQRTATGPKFPTRVTLWDPENVRAVTVRGNVTAWEYQSAQEVFRASPENVIQFKHWNPYDPIRGLAPLRAAILAAQGGYKALTYQDAFFENSAMMSGLLTPKEGAIIQPEAMTRLVGEIEARHQGSSKRGKLGAINAPVNFVDLSVSQKDMDFPQWLDAASAFILMVFKVPPSVAGLQKDANYNASVQQAKQFWFNHLPLAHYIERRIRMRLCRAFGIAETPFFKTESIKAMTEDQEAVSNIARNYWNMAVSFKDINDRLELGFPADDVSAETRWTTFSQVNADEQAMAPGLSDLGGPTRGPRQGEDQNQPGDESTVTDDPTEGKTMAEHREFIRGGRWLLLISKVRDEERTYWARLMKHFKMLKQEVLLKLHTKRKAVEPLIINIDDVIFDRDKAKKDLQVFTPSIYKSAIQKGYESVIRDLRIDLPFNLLTPEVESFLQEKIMEIADLVDQPAADRLRATLQEGVKKGENLEKIADRVEEVFDVERSRAIRIARTEVAEAFNGGRFETMKEAGVQKLEWLTARDNRVRDSHAEIDGEIIALGDRFSNGLLYPLDPAGPPEEIVNCRCVSLPAA